MKFFNRSMYLSVIIAVIFSLNVFADSRDPSTDLTKYVMYGDAGIIWQGSGQTANDGWVGTNSSSELFGSGDYNTAIMTEGDVDFEYGASINAESYVEGNFNYSRYGANPLNDVIHVGGSVSGSPNFSDPNLDINTSHQNSVAPVSILPSSTVINYNTNNCTYNGTSWGCTGGSSGIVGDTLLPGSYGKITVNGGSPKFISGTYEINGLMTSQNFGSPDIVIDKSSAGVTRILSHGNIFIENTGSLKTNSASDLGKVLLYTNGNYTQNNNTEIWATIYAPKGRIKVVSQSKVFGQLLAKTILIGNNFNGTAGAFVGFDPVGVSLVGADTYEITESTDADVNTRNSRLVSIPIALKAVTPLAATVDYEIRSITGTDTWGVGFDPAVVDSDSTSADLAHTNYGASSNTGTLSFNIGDSLPTSSVSFYVIDDDLPEDDAGELEYFALILDNPSGVVLENDVNAAYSDASSLIYLIPINSDDIGNQIPTDIATSIDTMRERTKDPVVLTGTDPDGNDANISFTLSGGANVGLFNLSNDTLILKSNAVFENASGNLGTNPLLVEVTATDEDGGTYSETLTLYISNRNDEKPQANNDVLTVNEGGSNTVNVAANDRDSIDNLGLSGTYKVISGGTYAISLNFSASTLTYSHDGTENFIDTVWYELNDGGNWNARNKDTAFVVVSINSVNDNTPDLSDDTLTVSEEELDGFILDTLVASDADNGSLDYSIVNQEHLGAFAISNDGVFTILETDSVDYEVDSLHFVEVEVDDGANKDTAQIWVKILNVNDNSPTVNDTTFTISESVVNNDDVGTILASDLDKDAVSYVIIDQEHASTFKINSSGLIEILNANNIDFESDTQHTFKVVVSDGSNSDTANVTVIITNENDNDPILNDTNYIVAEDESNGFSVGVLVGLDADGGTLTYQLDSAEYNGAFAIASDGEITISNTGLIDYETDSTHTLYVSILDTSSRKSSAVITINVTNSNDNSPVFSDTTISMFENKPQGQTVATLIATDLDNSVLTFTINHQEYNTAFTISTIGVLSLADSNLIDFETDSIHTIMVYVTDGIFTDSGLVTVNLLNVNDGTPIYNDTTLVVDEGATNGTSISTHIGIDPDGDLLTYSIVSESINGMFEIDSVSGEVIVKNGSLIDFETDNVVSIVVKADDGINSANATITFNVNNLNDNTPILGDTTFSVAENATNGFDIGTLIGSDADGNFNSLIYSLDSAEYNGAFIVNSDGSIEVANTSILDYESDSTHILYVTVSDGTFSSNAEVTVTLSNSNDNSPVYNDTNISISESVTNGTSFGFHLASDADGDVLTYSAIGQDPSNTFTVTGSGELLLSNQLNVDYETDSTLTVTIEVSDGVNKDTALVTFNLTNANDNSPIIDDTLFTVSEDISNLTLVGALVASDLDLNSLTFELITQEVSGAFSLAIDGDLTVNNTTVIDHEANTEHVLNVRVGDGSFFDTATVTINITDVNDNIPISEDTTFTIEERSSNGTAVGVIAATDADGNTLAFTIQSQEYLGAFAIDSNGQISVANTNLIDFENDTQHDLVVRISDGDNQLEINVNIYITNANDNSPVLADTLFTISESSAVGFLVGQLTAVDLDGDALIFSILTQEHNFAFAVDPDGSLNVTNNDSIDYELDSQHILSIEVTDGINSDTAQVTVDITNENDNRPVLSDAVFRIDEDIENSTVIGSVIGSDADGTSLTYELVSQEYTGAFSYSNSGELTVLNTTLIDFEIDDTQIVFVRLISGGDTINSTIIVSINDKNDNLPLTKDTLLSISEDETVGTLLWTIPGDDDDLADFPQFELNSGNSENRFSVEPSTGRIYLDSSLDYETTNSYSLLINVLSGGDTVQSTVNINVINVNVSPVITIGTLTIDENTLAGTDVEGSVTAIDEDLTQIIWSLPDNDSTKNDLFKIDSLNGKLTLLRDSTVNFELDSVLKVLIVAADDSSSTGVYVDIVVRDVNDAPVVEDQTLNITENSPTGVPLDTVIANDEDINADIRYSIDDPSGNFTVDLLTGAISLVEGAVIDFEEQESYTVEVIVDDGQYQDTASVTIDVENVIETANIEIVEIFDDSDRSIKDSDEFFTSHDSVYIVVDKDGVIDTVKVGVEEGLNIIKQTNNDPTKDIFETVTLEVTVSKVDPVLVIVTSDSLPIDSTGLIYVNDLEEDSVWVEITYVNKDLDTVTIDSLVPLDDFVKEGKEKTFVLEHEDEFGNKKSTTVRVLLDTTPPILEIVTPTDRSESEVLEIDVEWFVVDNGDTLDFSNIQLVSNGTFAITREYTDFAGNKVSDTHYVKVKANDSGAKVGIIDGLVEQKTEEEIIEYFEKRDRESDPAFDSVVLDEDNDGIPDIEKANISVILPNSSVEKAGSEKAIELAVQTERGIIQRETFEEFETEKDETRFGLTLELFFPINGGLNSNGDERAGYIPEDYFEGLAEQYGWDAVTLDSIRNECDGDSTIWKLEVERIQFHIFDHLGQYVSKLNFDGFSLDDPRYQDDKGKVTLKLEIPQLKDGFESEGGDAWGSGVYIMSGTVRTTATPRACLEHVETLRKRTSSTNLLENVGYKREDK